MQHTMLEHSGIIKKLQNIFMILSSVNFIHKLTTPSVKIFLFVP